MTARGITLEAARTWGPGRRVLVAGQLDDDRVRRLAELGGEGPLPTAPESVILRTAPLADGVLVAAGSDQRGLMYALLELAARVRADGMHALEALEPLVESPALRVRGVYQFLMGPLDERWYGSTEFWRAFFSRLASYRFNRFGLVMGFDTGYLSPPYPFFVEADGYPGVRARGLSTADLARNTAHLNAIIAEAHAHGLELILGTWQQRPWTADEEVVVENLPADESALADYCAEGLKALLRALPELDGIHFRVNHEAGVGTQESNEGFWSRLMHAAAEARPDIRLEVRAKGLTDDMIRDARSTGLRVTVPTKYWCEHAGLPYHLTRMRREELTQLANFNHSRRYSYADMLRRPRDYDLLYRLWNNGTTSVLLWGDPDYAWRFAASCRLGDAAGFEISAPLALRWGHTALQREAWPLFDGRGAAPPLYEDERYWMLYASFGLSGYSGRVAEAVWEREAATRFPGPAAPALVRAYRSSGKILPLITAFHMPVHPQLRYWPEVSSGGALFVENNHLDYRYMGRPVGYLDAEPSDPGLFYGLRGYAERRSDDARYTPPQVAGWLAGLAADVRRHVEEAGRLDGMADAAEWSDTREDFLMLADMAEYHAQKTLAGFELLAAGDDPPRLIAAVLRMRAALASWRSLADRGARYHHDLVFQAGHNTGGRMGHWRDWIPELEADLGRLETLARDGGQTIPKAGSPPVPRLDGAFAFHLQVPDRAPPGRDLSVVLEVDDIGATDGGWILYYRHANQLEGAFRTAAMRRTECGFAATVPGDYVTPEWELLLYCGALRPGGWAAIAPGLYHPVHPMPYAVVRVV